MTQQTQDFLISVLRYISIAFAVLFAGFLIWLRVRSWMPFSYRTSFLLVFLIVILLWAYIENFA
jgi:hypothetical protein